MTLGTFIPHFSEFPFWAMAQAARIADRQCKPLKKGENGVNTQKVLHEDVKNLYTGQHMWQSYVYAWMFTTMWVTWMYSAGCPVLYIIAIVNFIVCYWVYKLLLVKHYQKSTEFDENFCMHTISYFKISIMWHVGVSLLMFTNFHTI